MTIIYIIEAIIVMVLSIVYFGKLVEAITKEAIKKEQEIAKDFIVKTSVFCIIIFLTLPLFGIATLLNLIIGLFI